MNDSWLVTRATLGDRKAFGRLVEIYQSPIRRLLLNLVGGDDDLSKDLAQETFIKAWLHIGSFRRRSKFSTWLYRIAYNTFRDYLRSKQNRTLGAEPDPGRVAADSNANQDSRMDFAQALKVLNEEERTAMLLFYMEDMTVDKVSQVMESPPGTIKSHLSRGRKKLAGYLQGSGYER